MSDNNKYKGIYRIPPARWRDWDYGANAAYFVTICTAHRKCFFGEIRDSEITLSEIGQATHDCWLQIPVHFPFVMLDTFVVMPNHVHGIIVINVETQDFASVDVAVTVETQNLASLQQRQWQPNKFGAQSKNLASIIRGFKIGVTKYATANTISFGWQSRFHDRVIRNNDEHARIVQYIDSNITNWNNDDLYST